MNRLSELLRYAQKMKGEETGSTLAITLMIMVILILIGAAALMTSSIDLRITGNERVQKQAFYAADAGLNYTRSDPAISVAINNMIPANPRQSQSFPGPAGGDATFTASIQYGVIIIDPNSPLRGSPNPVTDNTTHNPILFRANPPVLSHTGIRTGVKAHHFEINSTGLGQNQAQASLGMQSYRLGYSEH